MSFFKKKINKSIKNKFIVIISSVIFVIGAISLFLLVNTVSSIIHRDINSKITVKVNDFYSKVNTASKENLSIASLFSYSQIAKQGYEIAYKGNINNPDSEQSQKAREFLRNRLKQYLRGYKKALNNNLRIHFHLPPARSLLRSWRKKQTKRNGKWIDISDDLSSFRKTIIDVNKTGEPVKGIEIGRGGFAIRGISGVYNEQGRQIGSVEVLSDFNDLFISMKTDKNENLALYMNYKYRKIATKLQNNVVLNEKFVRVASTDKKLTENLINADFLSQLKSNIYFSTKGEYRIAVFPIKDYAGKKIGVGVYLLDISSNLAFLNNLILFIILGLFIIIAVLIVINSILFRGIINPIVSAIDFANKIAEKDLTGDIKNKYIKKSDETGDLAKSLIRMQETLIGIVYNMQNVGSMISNSAEENAMNAETLADGSQNQSASVEQTTASIEELTSSVSQVSDNAKTVNDNAEGLKSIAEKSIGLVQNTSENMEKIKNSSNRIFDILDVINDITDKTNLLALNAAIEAARAGEHGRGFAVVADEITKLAEKSNENAKEIEVLIKQNVNDVETGAEAVNETSDAFNKIIERVQNNVDLMAEIKNSIDQQMTGTEEVQNAMVQISDVTQNISASSEELSASTQELHSQADKISYIFKEFKLPDENSEKGMEIYKKAREKTGKAVEWNNSFSVNVNQMDSQHKKWINYINDLHEAIIKGKGRDVLGNILNKMLDYSKEHLATEEELLRKTGYHEYEKHKQIHDNFVNWVKGIIDNFSKDKKANLSLDIMDKMKNWLTNHIKTVDKKYSEHLNKSGVK
jgi:methyl-accepting chemotaxis protein